MIPRRRPAMLFWIAAGLVLLFVAAVCLALHAGNIGRHPVFGTIRESMAADLNEARADPFGKFLRAHLPFRFVTSRYFPYQFKDQPRYLRLGNSRMEWSLGGSGSGWFYFHEPGDWSRADVWEFAPSPATNLLDLNAASLLTHFYACNDTNLQKAFGPLSTTNALHVEEGQVLFAHNTADQSVYAVHLTKQNGNRLNVYYVQCSP